MDHLGCCKLCTYYIEKENKKNSMSGVAEGEGIREIKEKKYVYSMHMFYAALRLQVQVCES